MAYVPPFIQWFLDNNKEVIPEPEPEYIYKDRLTLQRIETIHPKLKQELLLIYDEICRAVSGKVVVRFSSVLRTNKEQDVIYAQGRTTPGRIVTNAKGGSSYHNYGLAVDIVLLVDNDNNGVFEEASWSTKADFDKDGIPDWQETVAIFKRYGWEWGGDWRFKDDPHFQKTFGYNISQLQNMKKDGNNYPLIKTL